MLYLLFLGALKKKEIAWASVVVANENEGSPVVSMAPGLMLTLAANNRGMVCSFITSTEYQHRFSNVVTHSNVECG